MRILFAFAGGFGHFEPLAPVARAARAAGHTIAVAGRRSVAPAIEAEGFTAIATGGPERTPERGPLPPIDMAHEDRVLREGFAGRGARRRAAEMLGVCAAWPPDLLVCDELDFGSMVVAERLGIPHATVLVMAAGSFVRHALVAEPLNELRAEHGLPADPDLAMLSRYLVLSPFPASLRDPACPLPATAHAFRARANEPEAGGADAPWLARADGRPIVYFTLGTVYNRACGDLFERVLAALSELPVHVVATVGRDIDPAEVGSWEGSVHVERFIAQSRILPHCALVVSHGGSGTVTGALAHGVPLLLMPMGADHPQNAARCAALGAARVLDPAAATATRLRREVSELLADEACRRAAARLRLEVAALPGPEWAVSLLERLAADQHPIVSM